MASVRLTDTAILAAAKRAIADAVRVDLPDAGERGLNIRLTPAGSRSWVLRLSNAEGVQRRVQLGAYPAVSIAEARLAARKMRESVRAGSDPVTERKRARLVARDARDGIGTLASLLDVYAKQHGRQLKSWPECRRRINSVFAAHLGRPLATLRRTNLQMTADGWASQQSAAAGVRYLRPVLRWAADRDICSADLYALKPPATVKRRGRVLDRDELTALLPVLVASARPYATALRFMLLTLARREEVCSARWRDVDLEAAMWRIPATKNGQPHVVPLSSQAVTLLSEHGTGKKEDLLFATAGGTALANWDRETKSLMRASKTSGWTRHDLRRTGATMLGEMGELPDIIEAALNHTSIRSALAATYNRSRYRPQVAIALQRLADALDGIVSGAAIVVPLRKASASQVSSGTS